jgi:hypothetical protein
MSQTVSPQHPAVVLRTHYAMLRNLLAVATIAVVGLSVAVAILATTHGASSSRAAFTERQSEAVKMAVPGAQLDHRGLNTRPDGGPEKGTRGPLFRHARRPSLTTARREGIRGR